MSEQRSTQDPSARCCVAAPARASSSLQDLFIDQDLPCTLNWGYMVPNSGNLSPKEEGLGTGVVP